MVIRGVKNIEKVNLRKLKQHLHYDKETVNYENKETYVSDN